MSKEVNARWKSLLVFLCVVLSFLYLLNVSWFRWGSLVIDTFRDMNVCDKLLSGNLIYRDIAYEYGFLPPLILSAVCRVFGLKIAAFAGTGIIISIMISFLLYKISRIIMDRIGSILVVLVYLFVIAFGLYDRNGIFNLIIPYSFASVMFIYFVLAALFFFLKYLLLGRFMFLLLWAVVQTLALLCRPDMAIATWICFAGSVGVLSYINVRRNKIREILSCVIILLFPVFASVAAYWLCFIITGGWEGFKLSCLKPVLLGMSKYLSSNMGMGADIGVDFKLMIESLVVHGLGVIVMGLGVILLARSLDKNKENTLQGVFLGVSAIFCSFLIIYKYLFTSVSWMQYKCIPVLLIVGLLFSAVRLVKNNASEKDMIPFVILSVALATIVRVIFISSPFSYSFCIIPALIYYYYFFLEVIPFYLNRLSLDFNTYLFKSLMVCIFLLLIGKYWNFSSNQYLQRNMKVVSDVGEMFCFQDPASLHTLEAVKYLIVETPPDAGVVVVPECMSVNFLSRRQSPLKYASFVPGLFTQYGDEVIVRDFNKARPGYVVLAGRVTAEHGSPFFGLTYGQKLYECILRDYRLVKQIGQYPFKADDFGIAIYQRIPCQVN
jgi:hypothetical protein